MYHSFCQVRLKLTDGEAFYINVKVNMSALAHIDRHTHTKTLVYRLYIYNYIYVDISIGVRSVSSNGALWCITDPDWK